MSGIGKVKYLKIIHCCLWVIALSAACSSGATITPAPQASFTTAPSPAVTPTEEDKFRDARIKMVENTIQARGVTDPDVIRAMSSVQRHKFVPDDYLSKAYADHPLPIGYGQTISQPYIVALMTELLELKPGDKVLEIGTGSGYQAAVLAELGFVEVYSIEIVPELAERAATTLKTVGYEGVHTQPGDGYYGWSEFAPFDAIIVTAAPDHLPAPLVEQLAYKGKIVIPIGPPGGYQTLWKFVKGPEDIIAYNMGGVAFVPFTGSGIEQGPDGLSP